MTEKYIEITNSPGIKNLLVAIISFLAFIAICVCEKCPLSLHLGIRSIVENVAISVLAAGIYYYFSEVIYAKRMKRKMAGIVNKYYKSCAEDIKILFWAITGKMEWYKDLESNAGACKYDWYDRSFLKEVESNEDRYMCHNRIDLLCLSIVNIERSVLKLEGVLAWCDEKEVNSVFKLYNSSMYKKLRLLGKVPMDKPVDYDRSLLKSKLQEIEVMMKKNEGLKKELATFVSKYSQEKDSAGPR